MYGGIIKSLCAIYRAYGGEVTGALKPERPPWFNKFKCWKSFFNEFGNQNDVDIYVIWDGDENSLSEYIKTFPYINFLKVDYKNNRDSLLKCYSLFDEVKDNYEEVYFCEDDYMHLPDSKKVLIEGVKQCHLFTLYHHPDRIFIHDDITRGHESISIIKYCYIRTGEATTGTVAMSKEAFVKVKDILIQFAYSGVGAPDDRGFFRYLLRNNLYRLWHPIHSYSTHVVAPFLGLFINWELFNEDIKL